MFSEKLKELRLQMKFTQQQMADRLVVDKSTYCRWEHSERPPVYAVERISKVFVVHAHEWLSVLDEESSGDSSDSPRVVHMKQRDAQQVEEETDWRTKALDVLSRMTDLLESILRNARK